MRVNHVHLPDPSSGVAIRNCKCSRKEGGLQLIDKCHSEEGFTDLRIGARLVEPLIM